MIFNGVWILYVVLHIYVSHSMTNSNTYTIYRMSNMDGVDCKELLWHQFWCQAFSPIIFMVEKCVHFDIWNKKNSKMLKGPRPAPLWFGSFLKFSAKSKFCIMSQIIGGTLWNFRNFFYSKYQNVHIFPLWEWWRKMSATKNEVTVAL